MASKAARYGVGIGTGAASGAALGTSILPGWGTLIGGVVGAGAGAIGAAVQNGDEDDQRAQFEQEQARQRKLAALKIIRGQMQKYGQDTSGMDIALMKQGVELDQAGQRERFDQSQQLDPNAFVSMAQNGAKAAGGIYRAANQPSMTQPTSIQGIPDYQTLQNQGDYQVSDIDPEKLQRMRGLV